VGAEQGSVALDTDGHIATVTIDRPAKLNAIDPAMLAQLEATIGAIEADDDVRVVIVASAGSRAFSVGADVNAWAALQPTDMWRHWVREGHRIAQRLASLRQPTICAIQGFAFGGGLEVALATDIRIAGEAATFAMPETSIGTLPGWGGTRRLAEVIGASRAKQMIFSGMRIDAQRAMQWGLVNEVTGVEELQPTVRDLAMAISRNAPSAVQLAKLAIDRDPAGLEAMAGAVAFATDDGREGIASFQEKRKAHFTGR
jgi:enoyl-CoA hydratase